MANEEQIHHWNEQAGPRWVEAQSELERMIGPHLGALLECTAPVPGERVLDVGCGTGSSTVELARRVAPGGRVLGIDISAPMLAAAKKRATGLDHVELTQADVQTGDLGSEQYDLVASRFGVMFFEDPIAAFRNVLAATRPGGRLGFVCWQSPQVNPWLSVPMAAATRDLDLPAPDPHAPGPFAFANRARIENLLGESGWSRIEIESFEHPVSFGTPQGAGTPTDGVEVAIDFLQRIGPLSRILAEIDDEAQQKRILDQVREALEQHTRQGELELGSAAWLVAARR